MAKYILANASWYQEYTYQSQDLEEQTNKDELKYNLNSITDKAVKTARVDIY